MEEKKIAELRGQNTTQSRENTANVCICSCVNSLIHSSKVTELANSCSFLSFFSVRNSRHPNKLFSCKQQQPAANSSVLLELLLLLLLPLSFLASIGISSKMQAMAYISLAAILALGLVSVAGVGAQSDSCELELPAALSNYSGLSCRPIWNNFVLRVCPFLISECSNQFRQSSIFFVV